MDETPPRSVDFSFQLVDDPLVFTTASTASELAGQASIAYTLSASKQIMPTKNDRLGDWSVFQAFIAKTGIRIISRSQVDSGSPGCGYIDDGTSFLVSSAMLTTYTTDGELRNKVALKRIKQLNNDENLEAVCLEILALMHPPLRSHENIINLLGLTWTTEVEHTIFPVLIVEFAELGSLDKYLGNHSVDTAEQAVLCIGVAEGLDVLHQCGIIHGDVKCENILIIRGPSGDIVPKLADFGFSLILPLEQLKAKLFGTPRWNAPELSEPNFTNLPRPLDLLPLLDVYSYGLLVWRVLKNGRDPFNGISPEEVLSLKVFGGNEVLRRAYQDIHAECDTGDPHLQVFEDILKRTLPRDPSERCQSLSWVKDSFRGRKTEIATSASANQSVIPVGPIEAPLSPFKNLGGTLNEIVVTQNLALPWELKIGMFRETAMHAEVDQIDSGENAFLLSLFYAIGFGTSKDYEKMLRWCIEAASHGSPLAKVCLVPFSTFQGPPGPLPSVVSISDYLGAVDSLTASGYPPDSEALACAFRIIKKWNEEAYSVAVSLFQKKVFIFSICSIVGSGNGGQRVWEEVLAERIRLVDIVDRIKVRYPQPENVLRIACIEGNMSMVDAAIEHLNADINSPLEYNAGGTPTMLAVNNGHYELAIRLISKHKANIHFTITDRLGRSTLDLIAEYPLTDYDTKQTAQLDLARLVIRDGQYISDPDAMESAFLRAAKNMNIQMCEILVDACNISELSTVSLAKYATALTIYHCYQPLDSLLSKATLPRSQSSFLANQTVLRPPVLCWVTHGNEYLSAFRSTLEVLQNHGESLTISTLGILAPLMKAVITGHSDFVQELINKGADPLQEEPEFANASPLMTSVGAEFSNPEAFRIMLRCLSKPLPSEIAIPLISLGSFSRPAGLECIRALNLGHHIDIPLYCGKNSSVLYYVILGGFDVLAIIDYLLTEGAAVDAIHEDGKTPVFVAIETQKLGVLQLLLSKGASRTHVGPKGSTPLHIAAAVQDNGEAMTILVRDITSQTDIGVTDEQGYTALHIAAKYGNVGALNALLQTGADPIIKDSKGRTPLDLAQEALIDASDVRSSSKARRHKLYCQQTVEILQRHARSRAVP